MSINYNLNMTNLTMYMQQINEFPLLKTEEEQELILKCKNGDEDAKNQLIVSNLKLVVHIAKTYTASQSLSLLDLIQEGTLGLYRAIENYDNEKGFKFSTYATYWIRQAISQSINDYSRTIRLPNHIVHALSKINKVNTEDYDVLKEASGLNDNEFRNVLNISQTPLSLDYTINEDNNTDVGDMLIDTNSVGPEEYMHKQINREILLAVLDTLDEREKTIIMQRYGLDDGKIKTLDEIGNNIHLTRERVRQIEALAIRKLRAPARVRVLRGILNEQ